MSHSLDTNFRFTGSGSPLETSYTCGSGVTVLVVGIVWSTGFIHRSGIPTYDSIELTQASTTLAVGGNDPTMGSEIWYLLYPETGSALTLSIPNPDSLSMFVQASSYITPTTQTTGFVAAGVKTGGSATPTIPTSAKKDGLVVAVMAHSNDIPPSTQSDVNLNRSDNGTFSDSNQYKLPTSDGTTNLSWTVEASTFPSWIITVVSFEEITGSITVTPDAIDIGMALPSISLILNDDGDADWDIDVIVDAVDVAMTVEAVTINASVTFAPPAINVAMAVPDETVSGSGFATVLPDAIDVVMAVSPVSVITVVGDATNVTVLPNAIGVTVTTFGGTDIGATQIDFVRMVGFIFSSEIAYMIEFGNEFARFYFDGAALTTSGGSHVEITTPYLHSDLLKLQIKQIADTMWIVHPDYAPRKLTRTSTTSFSLDTIVFKNGPFLKRNDIENDDGVTMVCSATKADQTGTLIASSDTFESGHVGAIFQLTHPKVKLETSGTLAANEEGIIGTAIDVFGNYTFAITNSGWTGRIILEKSNDSWVTATQISAHVSEFGVISVAIPFLLPKQPVAFNIECAQLAIQQVRYRLVSLSIRHPYRVLLRQLAS